MNPTERIDKQIAELADWRGQMFAQLRKLIHEADPDITEEWKSATPPLKRGACDEYAPMLTSPLPP